MRRSRMNHSSASAMYTAAADGACHSESGIASAYNRIDKPFLRLRSSVVEPRQRSLGKRGRSNFLAYQVGCTSLAVEGLGHEIGGQLSLMNSVRKTRLALKSGQLRMGT
jgi:hypothetical protein